VSVEVRVVPGVPAAVDAVATAVFADRLDDAPAAGFLAACGITGEAGQALALPGNPVSIVFGAGPADGLDAAALRNGAGALARAARPYRRVAAMVPDGRLTPDAAAGAIAEGFLLGGYRFVKYKTDHTPALTARLDLVVDGGVTAATRSAIAWAQDCAAAVLLGRDLGNEPGGTLTPAAFADIAVAVAGRCGLGCQVWDADRIAAAGLGGLLGVSRGSARPPRLVRLEYLPQRAADVTVALVGKGVTFDSGGLNLKPGKMMLDMKLDMAGAAAVLAAMSALGAAGCPVRVVGWLPLADNMPGGDATRIGDVLRTRNGTTVEVRNTDAEGRLLLADGLALAGEEHPAAIVDLATLTDAVPMAVGRRYAGLVSSDAAWLARVSAAAQRAGEHVWPLPLPGQQDPRLRSKVADLVNATGERYGQSVSAAMFLREFVPAGIPWAHIDMAGPVVSDRDDGEFACGATGFGVRTLIELLRGGIG
jgi:leucyl aminopeptidase